MAHFIIKYFKYLNFSWNMVNFILIDPESPRFLSNISLPVNVKVDYLITLTKLPYLNPLSVNLLHHLLPLLFSLTPT